jgi:hypothetical protein
MRDHLQLKKGAQELKQISAASMDSKTALKRCLKTLTRCLHIPSRRRFPIPCAVVVTKADACGLEAAMGGVHNVTSRYRSMAALARDAADDSPKVRHGLTQAGFGEVRSLIESRFPQVSYFAVSAFGRIANAADPSPFTPSGVLNPLVWLGYQARALRRTPAPIRWYQHGWWVTRRALRGQEGVRNQILVWALMFLSISLVGSNGMDPPSGHHGLR